MPQGHSHETTELTLQFLSEGVSDFTYRTKRRM